MDREKLVLFNELSILLRLVIPHPLHIGTNMVLLFPSKRKLSVFENMFSIPYVLNEYSVYLLTLFGKNSDVRIMALNLPEGCRLRVILS